MPLPILAIHEIDLLDLGSKDQITFTLLPSFYCKNGTFYIGGLRDQIIHGLWPFYPNQQ